MKRPTLARVSNFECLGLPAPRPQNVKIGHLGDIEAMAEIGEATSNCVGKSLESQTCEIQRGFIDDLAGRGETHQP